MAKSKPAAPVLTVTATEAKNRFGPLLETALRGGAVVITKHDAPKAVLLSMAEYEALRGATAPDLDELAAQFDARVASLQSAAARKSLKAAFGAAPAELGRLAVAAQRRRG